MEIDNFDPYPVIVEKLSYSSLTLVDQDLKDTQEEISKLIHDNREVYIYNVLNPFLYNYKHVALAWMFEEEYRKIVKIKPEWHNWLFKNGK